MKWIIANPMLALLLALAFLAGFFRIRSAWLADRLEQAQAKAKAQKEDYDRAQEIRRRVSDHRDERVRSLDDAGYRD